jgi:hypothetical protein
MTRIWFILMMSLIGCSRPPACYRPTSRARGWTDVLLPGAAPHLAAPDGIEQYRSGESALAWSGWERGEERRAGGTTTYTLRLPNRAEVVEVDFGNRLGGAALEIIGYRPAGVSYTVRSRFRTHESKLSLELDEQTHTVEVIVHHHLRAPPQPSWRVGRRVFPVTQPGRLFYFDPGEGDLLLCEAPGRKLGFHERAEPEFSTATTRLEPTVLTRLLHKGLDN